MKSISIVICTILFFSCKSKNLQLKQYTRDKLLLSINEDSLIFNNSENTYTDRFGDNSGSLYKFNNKGILVFYCFLNSKIYPYAEYYDQNGGLKRVEGRTSIQTRVVQNLDSSYRFSFLYSTFRKSQYKIQTITNFNDTLTNTLDPAQGYSNVGFFNIIVRDHSNVLKTSIINQVKYFDSLTNNNYSFFDTLHLKDLL